MKQRTDLIGSRAQLESEGETFGCFQCGAPLEPVETGGYSDLCESCEEPKYEIVWRGEVIDTAITRAEAIYLRREYQIAFAESVTMRLSRET